MPSRYKEGSGTATLRRQPQASFLATNFVDVRLVFTTRDYLLQKQAGEQFRVQSGVPYFQL